MAPLAFPTRRMTPGYRILRLTATAVTVAYAGLGLASAGCAGHKAAYAPPPPLTHVQQQAQLQQEVNSWQSNPKIPQAAKDKLAAVLKNPSLAPPPFPGPNGPRPSSSAR